jgi:hypothetical protein
LRNRHALDTGREFDAKRTVVAVNDDLVTFND